jgi:hypothetical protein
MAKTNRVVLICDLHGDGTDAVTTVRIGNGAARYDLDVCQEHLDQLTGVARRVRGRKSAGATSSARRRSTNKATRKTTARRRRNGAGESAAVRQWARDNGYAISDRGRIPGPVVEAFAASK